MEHIVVLTTLPYTQTVIDRIYSTTPTSSILTASDSNWNHVVERVKTRPFYSKYFWVLINCSNKLRAARELKEVLDVEWVRFAYLCPEKGTYNRVQEFLDKQKAHYALFNCYNVNYFMKVRFVRDTYSKVAPGQPGLPLDVVNYIAKRLSGNETRLEFYMTTVLNQRGNITKQAIGKLMPDRGYVTLSNFMLALFDPETSEDNIVRLKEMIAKYRGYPRPLIKQALNFFDTWQLIYDEYQQGHLNEITFMTWLNDQMDSKSKKKMGKSDKTKKTDTQKRPVKYKQFKRYNYSEFAVVRYKKKKLKDVNIESQFVMKKWLRVLNKFSYEFMILLKSKLERASLEGTFAGYVALIEISIIVLDICNKGVTDIGREPAKHNNKN